MLFTTRLLRRVACAIAVSACADSPDPVAPGAESPVAPAALSLAPTPEELAEMPPEFATAPAIDEYGTEVIFSTVDRRAIARGYMTYFATDATQDVEIDLRFENQQIASNRVQGVASDFFPWVRLLETKVGVGVSGTCGHLADGTTSHKAWHHFTITGWKNFEWGHDGVGSGDSAEQPPCPEPPPESPYGGGGGGGDDEYESDCEYCQEWLYYVDGDLVDYWWECSPISDYWCDGLMR